MTHLLRVNILVLHKTLDSHIPIALEILSDMLYNPSLSPDDMSLERQVIKEEIRMYEDSPEDLVYDLSSYAAWGDTPMAETILGTYESLDSITPDIMRNYMNNHYTSANTIISVSGNFDDTFFELLEKYFGTKKMLDTKPYLPDAPYISKNNIVKEKILNKSSLSQRSRALMLWTNRCTVCLCLTTCSAAECRQDCSKTYANSVVWCIR